MTQLPDFLKALAHEMHWKILIALSRSDRNVSELCRFLAQLQNVVSYHLRKLREQRVVSERRSSADSRDFYYTPPLNSPWDSVQMSAQAWTMQQRSTSNAHPISAEIQ